MQSQAPQADISKSFKSMLGGGAVGGLPMLPVQNGGDSPLTAPPVGCMAFLKGHAIKIAVLGFVLDIITILLVRATLVARSKKKQAIKDVKKEEDVQWENYFEEAGGVVEAPRQGGGSGGGGLGSMPLQRAQLPAPPQLRPYVAAVSTAGGPLSHRDTSLGRRLEPVSERGEQIQNALLGPRALSGPGAGVDSARWRLAASAPPVGMAAAPVSAVGLAPAPVSASSAAPIPIMQHNRQHQPLMPSADSMHLPTHGTSMLPESTRIQRESMDFTMPVSDVPITNAKSAESTA